MSQALFTSLLSLGSRAIRCDGRRQLHTTAMACLQKQRPGPGKQRMRASYVDKPTSRTRLSTDLKSSRSQSRGRAEASRWKQDWRPEHRASKEVRTGHPERPHRPGATLKREKVTKHLAASSDDEAAEVQALLDEEFDRTSQATSKNMEKSFSTFASPPLLPGLSQSINDFLGKNARPTAIQALSLQELVNSPMHASTWRQTLLASETGSGKSFAYLLPLIQYLKTTEDTFVDNSSKKHPLNPRALILAPTHELARQLSAFAKALAHNVKLRVLCASRANAPNRMDSDRFGHGGSTARQMKHSIGSLTGDVKGSTTDGQELEIEAGSGRIQRPVDIIVATPVKAIELVRGWGWDKVERDKTFTPSKAELGLTNVEAVVVDEADVLYDPDFQETTLNLLSDISNARGHVLPLPSPLPFTSSSSSSSPISSLTPLQYPFHLTLTSATIPASLSAFLSTFHPSLTRLVSPGTHRLPATLRTQHVESTGGSGNRFADVEERIRDVWKHDALRAQSSLVSSTSPPNVTSTSSTSSSSDLWWALSPTERQAHLSKILIFCNRRQRVEQLGEYLRKKGIENVALTGSGETRTRGSNKHLAGFLKPLGGSSNHSLSTDKHNPSSSEPEPSEGPPKLDSVPPQVLITTSLLSRGLDFDPSVRHVFIVDPPRNMLDFLHRAGRSGRAGEIGKVVVFGTAKGHGSKLAKEVRRKVDALAVRRSR